MLEVTLHNVRFTRGSFALNVSSTFPPSTYTAIIGPPASGASTLLQLIAGKLKPQSGEITIGSRVVNDIKSSRRPLLYVTSALDVPDRWSVQHALIAAVRQRTLDRVDRQREYDLAVEKWRLSPDRTIGSLSSSERTIVHLARIELLKPGILVADRLLEGINPSSDTADEWFRTLRVAGTTVISAPASREELGATDNVVVLSRGRVVQEGPAAQIHARPVSEDAADAMGAVNAIPVVISGAAVDSAIGAWEIAPPPFQGSGIALVRPEAFSVAPKGGESDLIVSVEEASFERGRWTVRALISGGITLRISLPAEMRLHKGKLLALLYDPATFTLIQRDVEIPRRSVPTDVVPSMKTSR